MKSLHRHLTLTRTGDADAEAALFSLPLPRGPGGRLAPVYSSAGQVPLAWWQRDTEPRRVLTALAATAGTPVPAALRFKRRRASTSEPLPPSPWTLSTPLTTERIPYVAHTFTDIDSLRGVPAADCTTLEYALELSYGGRTLRLQPGATGPGTAECLWQNVQIDRLWRHAAAEAVRVGGIIYNEDTYLWADLYLILFANGVVSATLHFTNTKLHIKSYDFRGLPFLKIESIKGSALRASHSAAPAGPGRSQAPSASNPAGAEPAPAPGLVNTAPPAAEPAGGALPSGEAPEPPQPGNGPVKVGGGRGIMAELPRDGWRYDLGVATFNFADSAITCSESEPARLADRPFGGSGASPDGHASATGSAVADAALATPGAGAGSAPAGLLRAEPLMSFYYTPFARIINAQKPENPSDFWEPGFARTVRFQFSLSAAAPAVARYVVPAWWYAVCGEPWPGGLLPVNGRFTPVAVAAGVHVRGGMRRGAFDGASVAALGGAGNDGGAGAGLMQQAYLTGDPGTYRDALDYCTYWADLAVDHTDFTVHQWLGGWGWKTCAYNKFRDVLFAYLETGDPWMRDTVEMTAEAYWTWFRSNWPRNAIGRDAFEVGGWALLWRYFRTEHARDRLRELVHMLSAVLASRGSVGGQMGVGPHPGWHASLYLTGVSMVSMLEAMEATGEAGDADEAFRAPLEALHTHYIREDVELFPVSLGVSSRANWTQGQTAVWALFGLHIYAGLGRRFGFEHTAVRDGFAKLRPILDYDKAEWGRAGRAGDQHLHPRVHDALMLDARVAEDGQGVELAPAFGAATLPWPELQAVQTPWGLLNIAASEAADGVTLTLTAPADFRVRLRPAGGILETRSRGEVRIPQSR